MKRTFTITLGLIAASAIALFFWPDHRSVQAQSGCKSFDALAQATLPTTRKLASTDKWGGPLFAKLGDELLPYGILSGNDGDKVQHGNIAQGINGKYVIGFNCTEPTTENPYWSCTDKLNVEVPISVFDSPPPLFGKYNGNTARVNGGTGRFANAYGNLNYSGSYTVWNTTPQVDKGRFNADISGNICGIE